MIVLLYRPVLGISFSSFFQLLLTFSSLVLLVVLFCIWLVALFISAAYTPNPFIYLLRKELYRDPVPMQHQQP